MTSYHGWTHAPKEQGGTDPIPGTSTVQPMFRGFLTGDIVAEDATLNEVYWEDWWISDDAYFEAQKLNGTPATLGVDNAYIVACLAYGRYGVLVGINFDSDFSAEKTILVNTGATEFPMRFPGINTTGDEFGGQSTIYFERGFPPHEVQTGALSPSLPEFLVQFSHTHASDQTISYNTFIEVTYLGPIAFDLV